MTFVIEQTIEVMATPAVVWEVIVDLPRYGEWNPFVVECRPTLAVGDPIARLRGVRPPAARDDPGARSRRAALLRLAGEPARQPGVSPLPRAPGHGRRAHALPVALSGWLMPVVREPLGRRLQQGFQGMTVALGRRAEHLVAARRTSRPS